MPAVSVCDHLTVAIGHSLDTDGQSKSSDDLNIGLAGSASRILRTEIEYEETDNYRSTVQDQLKRKYMVLSVPKQENSESSSGKDGSGSSKSSEKSKEPTLPEPSVTLYAADKVNLGWNKNFPIGAGMYNVGNTCYLNSTLQALFHVPALVNWLLSDSHHESKCEQNDGGGECLTCAVAKTLQFSHQKSGDAIKPFYVYNKLKLICRTMQLGQQEDAHEFLRYLLEGMEKAYLARHKATKLDSYSKETTPINQIFGGYIRTEVKCLQCRHVSTTFQHFQDLLLDIRKAGTLDDALQGYFSQEQLDNNDYKCEACKRRVPATKQFILERPPKVLCVQLKRFSVLGGKISRHIGFKTTVDMGPYLRRKPGEPTPKLVYRLASMVTHMGPSVNCGHYTAIAQVSSGKFYSFDDSCVRVISLNNVMTTNAYIMIFEMEPPSTSSCPQIQGTSSQVAGSKSDGPRPQLSSFTHSNGLTNKLSDTSGAGTSSGGASGSSSKGSPSTSNRSNGVNGQSRNSESQPTPPPPPLISTHSNSQASQQRRSIIGPVLPPGMDKAKLQELETLSLSSNGNKLVDYEAESSDDDYDAPLIKPYINGNDPRNYNSKSTSNGLSNGHHYYSNGSNSSRRTPTPPRITSNGEYSKSKTPERTSGSSSSSRATSPNDSNKNWNYSKQQRHNSSERKVYTKASSINKGWHVCKDSPSPSSSSVATNGWSVSDNMSDESNGNSSRSNNHSVAPNAADMRNFNGTNRSDTTSHLMKSSQWAYGNNSVNSWNGGKARIDREVESQRHHDRLKRLYDNDDDEMDRGRTKKIKHNHKEFKDYDDRNRNYFQEYHSNKWSSNHPNNGHYRSRNGHPYSRHGHNRQRSRQRFNHSKSRDWRR